jgi:hypothetical protein
LRETYNQLAPQEPKNGLGRKKTIRRNTRGKKTVRIGPDRKTTPDPGQTPLFAR